MTIYSVRFYTTGQYADEDVEADTPEQALEKAKELIATEQDGLDYYAREDDGVNEIRVWRGGETLAAWQHSEVSLRLAAQDLLEALEQALQALNTAPRFRIPHLDTDSYEIAAACDRAIAKAKGGAA
jgi:hypothetical protein